MPLTGPTLQPFGSVLGQPGSTSKDGMAALADCPAGAGTKRPDIVKAARTRTPTMERRAMGIMMTTLSAAGLGLGSARPPARASVHLISRRSQPKILRACTSVCRTLTLAPASATAREGPRAAKIRDRSIRLDRGIRLGPSIKKGAP